jgi:hypothetical protein
MLGRRFSVKVQVFRERSGFLVIPIAFLDLSALQTPAELGQGVPRIPYMTFTLRSPCFMEKIMVQQLYPAKSRVLTLRLKDWWTLLPLTAIMSPRLKS